jgi:trehalose 6-phosphate phosphatase
MTVVQAVIFDLDGVITDTASVHFKAWKWAFEEFLTSELGAGKFREFSMDDYHDYVDGNPRYVGVQKFIESRGLSLPMGAEQDHGWKTVFGIGNAKNRFFTQLLITEPVNVFDDSLEIIRAIREASPVKCGVASSSINCRAILEKVNLLNSFDVIHDGNSLKELGLRGKPAPDIFIRTMADLKVDPSKSVIFEDAISGVQAARASGAGLVIGVDRKEIGLKQFGAHHAVENLRGMTLAKFGELF